MKPQTVALWHFVCVRVCRDWGRERGEVRTLEQPKECVSERDRDESKWEGRVCGQNNRQRHMVSEREIEPDRWTRTREREKKPYHFNTQVSGIRYIWTCLIPALAIYSTNINMNEHKTKQNKTKQKPPVMPWYEHNTVPIHTFADASGLRDQGEKNRQRRRQREAKRRGRL